MKGVDNVAEQVRAIVEAEVASRRAELDRREQDLQAGKKYMFCYE